MLRRLGYACLCPSVPDSSPKGTILRHATPERLRELIGTTDDANLPSVTRRAFTTWKPDRDGPPKIYYSTQAPGQRSGKHAHLVDADEFRAFLDVAPAEIDFDCMLEAKAKEAAVLALREVLGPIESGLRTGALA